MQHPSLRFLNAIQLPYPRIFAALSFLGIVSILYQPATALNFAVVDDDWMLLGDKMVSSDLFSWKVTQQLLNEFNSLQYAPLNTIFYWLIHKINGYDPYYYHVLCLCVHVANVMLLYLLSKKLLDLFQVADPTITAYLISLIWAIHPLNVESVVWISASKILLFTCFTLISMLLFIEFLKGLKFRYYLMSVLAFILSCFCKEQAVMLPVILTILLMLYPAPVAAKKTDFFWAVSLYFLIALIFGLITIKALSSAIGEQTPFSHYPIGQRMILSTYCLLMYMLNTVFPYDLHFHYPFPMAAGAPLPILFYIFPPILCTLCYYVYRWIRQHPMFKFYLFALSIFIVNLALSIQIVPLSRPAIMADRYMYLPLVGLLYIIVPETLRFLNRCRSISAKQWTTALLTLGIFVMAAYSRQLIINWNKLNIA